jgi:hypothetical protein
VKRLAAALHGKLSQHAVDWVEVDKPCLSPWSWWSVSVTDSKLIRRRAIGWIVQEKRATSREPADAFPAIGAWTTSAARIHMLSLRSLCGDGNWVYQFSDTIVVTQQGLDRLLQAGAIDSAQLGLLKVDWTADKVEIRGPGWIMHDDRRRACGIPKDAQEVAPNKYETTTETSLAGMVSPGGIRHYSKIGKITHYPPSEIKGIRRRDGLIDPPHLQLA